MTEETIEYRLNAIDEKQEKSDKKLDELVNKIDALDKKLDIKLNSHEFRIEALENKIKDMENKQVKKRDMWLVPLVSSLITGIVTFIVTKAGLK